MDYRNRLQLTNTLKYLTHPSPNFCQTSADLYGQNAHMKLVKFTIDNPLSTFHAKCNSKVNSHMDAAD